jgi:hypothetical protein
MWYWMLQPVAFIVEGVVQFVWGKAKTKASFLDVRMLGVFERLVGYAWVCAWLIWEAPKYSFPLATCAVNLGSTT